MFGMRADPEEESRKAAERKARRVKIAQELKEKARTGKLNLKFFKKYFSFSQLFIYIYRNYSCVFSCNRTFI